MAEDKDRASKVVWIIAAICLGACILTGALSLPMLGEALEGMFGHRHHGSGEAAAIGALRTITTAQALYREGDKDKNGTLDYAATLRDLQAASLIDQVLGSGTKQGYRFRITHADPTTWAATAVPLKRGVTGDRSFFVDESGVIRFSTTVAPASVSSTAIGG